MFYPLKIIYWFYKPLTHDYNLLKKLLTHIENLHRPLAPTNLTRLIYNVSAAVGYLNEKSANILQDFLDALQVAITWPLVNVPLMVCV